ncbi:MAG: 2-oxoglutarate dehydrogenase E1 component, partial [Paracoccaceae bacterium]
MTEQSSNDQFHNESFLQGHNAEYVEQLQARFANDPNSVDESWQRFFRALGEETTVARAEAAGPSWARTDWPPTPNDDLTAALDGQWASEPEKIGDKIKVKATEVGVEVSEGQLKQAVLDSLRALMLIRTYRVRGHLAANLDPLALKPPPLMPELEPSSYGFTEADMDRPIFIDNVLGLETASMR